MSNTPTLSSKQIVARACKRFNPSDVAITLGWFDRTSQMYYIYGIFPLMQHQIDSLSSRLNDKKMHRMGGGSTLDAACDDLDRKIFGGL